MIKINKKEGLLFKSVVQPQKKVSIKPLIKVKKTKQPKTPVRHVCCNVRMSACPHVLDLG